MIHTRFHVLKQQSQTLRITALPNASQLNQQQESVLG
jgi:hypothetical protein